MTPAGQGYAMMVAAAMLIPLGDAVAKAAHEIYDVPISFLAWSRFALGAVLLAPFALAQGVRPAELLPRAVLLRGLAISATVFLILQGAARAPLADAYGAFFVAPLVSFVLAVLVLRETPGPARAGLMTIGFLGVLLVTRPGGGISTGLLFALAAGVFYGAFLTASRAMAGRHRALAMLWAQLGVGGVVMAPFALVADLPGAPLFLALVLASALTSVTANYLIVLAYRRVEATRLAPLIYVQLIGATLYGAVIFGTMPDRWSLLGLVLLLASGLAALFLRRKKSARID